jgi:class 3 adenylate cyclase
MSATDDMLLKNLETAARLEDAFMQKRLLRELVIQYVRLERRVSDLLRNTLPTSVADEIQLRERFAARPYECTILFADIAGFTHLAERISAEALIGLIDELFRGFDELTARHGGTKIKTIGDAYMVAFNAPDPCPDHAVQAVRLALAMIERLADLSADLGHNIQMRIGVHTGSVMGGVVGRDRMQFDIFGDQVNVASRFESSGAAGRVNCSAAVYEQTRHLFTFEERGEIPLKNKGTMKAYFVVPGGVHDRH